MFFMKTNMLVSDGRVGQRRNGAVNRELSDIPIIATTTIVVNSQLYEIILVAAARADPIEMYSVATCQS